VIPPPQELDCQGGLVGDGLMRMSIAPPRSGRVVRLPQDVLGQQLELDPGVGIVVEVGVADGGPDATPEEIVATLSPAFEHLFHRGDQHQRLIATVVLQQVRLRQLTYLCAEHQPLGRRQTLLTASKVGMFQRLCGPYVKPGPAGVVVVVVVFAVAAGVVAAAGGRCGGRRRDGVFHSAERTRWVIWRIRRRLRMKATRQNRLARQISRNQVKTRVPGELLRKRSTASGSSSRTAATAAAVAASILRRQEERDDVGKKEEEEEELRRARS